MSTAIMITVATFAEDGSEALQHYVEGVLPLLEQAGASTRRYQGMKPLVGDDLFDLVAVIEFPSNAAINQFLSSDAYMAMEPHRDNAFKFIRTFACNTLL